MSYATTFSPSRRLLIPILTVALLFLGLFTAGCDTTEPGEDTSEGDVPYADISGFFAQRGANLQSFSVSPNGETLTTSGGMELTIPSDAFVDSGGDPIQGNVDISVREAFSIEDMINTNLTTVGDGDRQLITGGMFDIDASASGSAVTLDGGINVRMPAETNTGPFTNQMTVWTADRDADADTMSWTNTRRGTEVIRDSSDQATEWFFQITDLQWFNCDVFWNADPRYSLKINQTGFTGSPSNLKIFVVSGNPTGVLGTSPDGQGAYDAIALAGDNDYTVVAIAVEDNVQYYGEVTVTLSSNQTVTVDLVPTSESDLDAALQAL